MTSGSGLMKDQKMKLSSAQTQKAVCQESGQQSSQPKLVSAKKEIIGLIWEASPQNPPRLVFASVCFHPCVYMRVWLSKCVSLFYLCISPGEPSQNNRAAVLYSILSLDDIQSHFSCTNQPSRTGGPLHARSNVQHWESRAFRRTDLCHLPISLRLPH